MVGVIKIPWENGHCQSWIVGKVLWRIWFKMFNPDAVCGEGMRNGALDVPRSSGWATPLSSAWLFQMSVVVDLPKDNIPLCTTLRTWSEVSGNLKSGPYIFKDLRSLSYQCPWHSLVYGLHSFRFSSSLESEWGGDLSLLPLHPTRQKCLEPRGSFHALQLLIRKVWWGSKSWQSLWICAPLFQCGIEYWTPWVPANLAVPFGAPSWECFPRWEDAFKAGRLQCKALKQRLL